MLLYILAAIAVIIVVLLVGIATRPVDFSITRWATIVAPPAVVFAQVNDFHQWNAWSPWVKMDPQCQTLCEGSPSGKGAIYRWAGNAKVGAGNMTITESRPAELILIRLEFIKPLPGVNTTEFTFKVQGNQTVVGWKMSGKNNFIGKAMHFFINCDKMIGAQFEQGLAAMKKIAETAAHG
ncbi:MAG TPA: SRPBCC family protein [Opitutales bacterium]|jgi:hypothetical protein|nr:SRPBCC family protein [Opitutales bacterium]